MIKNNDITNSLFVETFRKKAGHYSHLIRSKKQDIHKSINHVVDVWNNGDTVCPIEEDKN